MSLFCFALTLAGMVELILPRILIGRSDGHSEAAQSAYGLIIPISVPSIVPTSRICASTAQNSLSSLPYEIRSRIYHLVCQPDRERSTPGALHLLLLNKEIYAEAKAFFAEIPHSIVLADVDTPDPEVQLVGTPRRLGTEWHHSIKRLVLVVSICSIGKMSPDTFDVNIPRQARNQWSSLKKLVGIWPEARHLPLEEIKIMLKVAGAEKTRGLTHRAELIRYIRNFKRTIVWASTGDCGVSGKKSVLLPLVRAFNQARRNWVEESDFDNNLFIRFDGQRMNENDVEDRRVRETWEIKPTMDTSRTDNQEYPPLTKEEENYIDSKMLRKEPSDRLGLECPVCLAYFENRTKYAGHLEPDYGTE